MSLTNGALYYLLAIVERATERGRMAGRHWDDVEQLDDGKRDDRLTRPIVWLISLFVVIVLIGIPIVRAINYSRSQSPEKAAAEARAYVAGQFAGAVLEHRSTSLAEEWAIPGLHDDIDRVVGDLQVRDAAELAGATARVVHVSCSGVVVGGSSAECFSGSLIRPDGHVVTRMDFVVAIFDGKARVVQVGSSA
jgi:hypothetical protein